MQDLLTGIEGYSTSTHAALPVGLAALVADPLLGAQLTPDWVQTLARIELRGRRPQGKQDWYESYLHHYRDAEFVGRQTFHCFVYTLALREAWGLTAEERVGERIRYPSLGCRQALHPNVPSTPSSSRAAAAALQAA